jgi:hypothetical protein
MEITNEDKILLLEKLGYAVDSSYHKMSLVHKMDYWHYAYNIYVPHFFEGAFLDMNILSKLMDVVEKKWDTELITLQKTATEKHYRFAIYHDIEEPEFMERGDKREEAILKALLRYFKNNNK